MQLTHWQGEPVAVWERLWSVPRFEAFDSLTSTNDRALALARSGTPPFSVVIAGRQTAGRGRSGKKWHAAPDAGLWLSVVLPHGNTVPVVLPLVVGLAAAYALESLDADLRVGLKWPNDLFLKGRKLGGVLCEAVRESEGRSAVVAGLGINVHTPEGGFPADVRDLAVSLEDGCGTAWSLAEVATRLISELQRLCGAPVQDLGPEHRAAFAQRDVLAGSEVVTALGRGTARGIDASGALLLERTDGRLDAVRAGGVERV